MKTSTKTILGFFGAAAVIIAIGIFSDRSIQGLIDDSHWVYHTLEVQADVEKLRALNMETQTNVRGFHITGQEYFLERYHETQREVPATLEHIAVLIKDNPDQQARMQEVGKLLDARMKRWADDIELRKTQGLEGVQKALQGPIGKGLDEALSKILDDVSKAEKALLEARLHGSQRTGNQTSMIVSAGSLCALFLVFLATYIIFRDTRKREAIEAELDHFFTLSLDLLCISGLDGYFKRLSPAYVDTLGFSLDELYRMPIIDLIHPDDVEKTRNAIKRQAGGERISSFENRYRTKDGQYRLLSWKSVPHNGLMYAVARDVTDRKKWESELITAKRAAQQAANIKAEFLANMSHEIRTPLNGILGTMDLLRDTNLDADQKELTELVRGSGQILLRIINEILDFSKIEAGKLQLEVLEFEVPALLETQVSLIGRLAHEKNLQVRTFVDPRIPNILRGDSGRIGQILLNLLSNAVKFTESGDIVVGVQLESMVDNRCVAKFTVQDTGIGMHESETRRLFQPFAQADGSTARKYGGTGLGLSISKRLAELMGGTIGVISQPGEGSTFWFTVDLEVPPARAVEHMPSSLKKPKSAPNSGARKAFRILVAEDNHVNQIILMRMLEKLGYPALLTSNGSEAVEAFAKGNFDLVLMDHHMPIMDGREATLAIRKLEEGQNKRVPIIGFTANVLQENSGDRFGQMMDGFLFKPVGIDTLEATLHSWEQKKNQPVTLQ